MRNPDHLPVYHSAGTKRTVVNREWAAYWRSLLAWHVNNPHDDMCACGDRSPDCRIRRVAVKKGILRDITENLDHMGGGL